MIDFYLVVLCGAMLITSSIVYRKSCNALQDAYDLTNKTLEILMSTRKSVGHIISSQESIIKATDGIRKELDKLHNKKKPGRKPKNKLVNNES